MGMTRIRWMGVWVWRGRDGGGKIRWMCRCGGKRAGGGRMNKSFVLRVFSRGGQLEFHL